MKKISFRRILALVLALALGLSTSVNPAAAATTKKVVKLTVKAAGTLYEGQKLTKSTLKKVVIVKALYKGSKKAKKVTSFTCPQVGKVVKPSNGKFKLTVKAGGKKRTVKLPVAKVKSLQLSANEFTVAEGETFKPSQFKAKATALAGYGSGILMKITSYTVKVVKVTAKKITVKAVYGSISSKSVAVKIVAKATATPKPTLAPEATAEPSASAAPSASASPSASVAPSATVTPTVKPSVQPSVVPTATPKPTTAPTATPWSWTTAAPTTLPTSTPKPTATVTPSSSPATKGYTVTINSNSSNVNLNGRGLAFSNGTASEVFPAGTSVSLSATDSNSYRFVRWASAGTELSTSKSYSFTVNSDTVINAVFESVYTLTVKIIGGKCHATLGGESLDFYSNVANINQVPGTYLLQVEPTDDYQFVSITDEIGNILSTNPTYNVGLAAAKTITINLAEAEKTVMVTYVTSLGQKLKSEAVAFGETLEPSTNTSMSGYEFKGWKIGSTIYYGSSDATEFYADGGQSLSDAIKDLTKAKQAVTVETYYVEETKNYCQLVVNNGNVSDTSIVSENGILEGTHVTVVADAPATGKKFSCWQNGAGETVSNSSIYTFKLTANLTLTAVYVDDAVQVEPEPLVFFNGSSYNVDYSKGIATFYAACEIPAGYSVVEWGIIKGTDVSAGELTLANVGTGTISKNVCPTQSTDRKVYWTADIKKKSWFTAGTSHNVTAVVYATVSNANGSRTIYSSSCSFTITN